MLRLTFGFSALLTLGACGGKVIFDGEGTSGIGGSGGAPLTTSTTTTTDITTTTTTTVTTTTTGVTCPDPFPGISAPCQVEGLMCAVPNACCNGGAICKNGFWKFSGVDCQQPCEPECGPDGFACVPGAVCATLLGKITTYRCEKDPCGGSPLSCSCAAPLCAAEGLLCNNIQGDYKVLCDCQGNC